LVDLLGGQWGCWGWLCVTRNNAEWGDTETKDNQYNEYNKERLPSCFVDAYFDSVDDG
jgi:hypothetical protein